MPVRIRCPTPAPSATPRATERALAISGRDRRRAGDYERHRPERTTLYAVVRDNVETLYAAVAAGFEGVSLPPFVRREFDSYLDCGLLCRGFARLKCVACAEQHLVAFSCKGRGFCPSCMGRRMCQTAANLVEHVLPSVPLRQWVLTLPYELRGRLGFDGKLLGAVARIFVDSILGWYRRRLRAGTHERVEGGAVVAVQRAASDPKLNPHLHVVFLDGVYAAAADGTLEFRALSRLSTTDVADALQVARARILACLERRNVIHRILACLERRNVIHIDADVFRVDDALAERDDGLALPPLGRAPEADVRHRRRNVPPLRRPHAPPRPHHRAAERRPLPPSPR